MAITSIDESRARRAAQRAVVADPLQYTPPEQQKPTVLGRQVETDEAAIAEKGIGARFVNDAALMAHGFQALPAIMYEKGVVGSAKLLGEGVLQFGKDITGIIGLRGGEAQKETAEYYKNHPGFAVADAVGIASFGGGALLKNSLTTIAKNSIRTATESAAKYGVARTIINNAIMATRSIISPARILGKERIIGTFEKGLEHAVRTGDTVRVVESMTANLIKQGVESGIASKIARETANDVSKQIIQQSAKLKNFDRVAHPVGTIFGEAKAGIGAGAARLVGTVEPTALGTILGAGGREAIAVNKKAASQIERWAQKIVLEKGLPDTIENRAKELASWNDDVNYAALNAEGKFRHWENFVKTDIDVKQLRDLNPDASKTIVPVKAISKSGADAMVKTLDDNIEAIKGIIDSTPNIDPAQRSMLIWDKVVELLSDVGGRDFINYSTTLREVFGANANIDKLKKAIVSYTTEKPSLAIRKWTPEEKVIVDRIVKSGYQIGYAPTGKKVSFAAELVDGKKISPITDQTFTDTRNWLGKALEDWGFSTRGTFAGAKGLAYKLNFTQNVINDIGDKFGATITIKKPIVINNIKQGVSRITIPIEKIHDWLSSHKDEIFKLRGKGGGGGLSKWEAFRPVAVSDLSVGDLTRIGFDADLAKAVKDVAGKSLREVSPAVTGMLEHVVDIMRSGDNIFSRFYDMTYKTALYSRYQSVAAVLFQIQQVTETRLVAAMMTKDWRLIPGIATTAKGATKALSFGERMVPEKVGRIITNAKTYLKDIVNEVSDAEMSISHEFLMKDVLKFAQDQVSASEFGAIRAEDAAISAERATRKIESAADIVGKTQTKAAWINYLGGNYTAQGARIGKALAKRFGLTLEEVFGDFVERVDSAGNTQKIYKYQNLINEMQGAVTQALGYKAGFQTAPIVKSLNIIWFPFRFQAKTLEITAKWFGSLDPGTRLFVLNNWVHTANFMGSEEGIEWRRTNKNMLYDILAYTTAWQQMGNSLEAISRGQLFGGNTGLIGGVPFGFIYNLAQALAILPEDPEQFDPATGKQFQFKEVPTKIISERAFLTAVEEFVFMMLPGMPLYTLTSGSIRGISWRHYTENFIEQFYPWLKGGLTTEGTEEMKRKLKGETSRIGMEERRTIPQIIGEFKE